jgi:hypothetical protein
VVDGYGGGEAPQVVARRGTEFIGWYLEQQRERAPGKDAMRVSIALALDVR